MEKLICDVEKEMDAIAIRFIVMKLEHPNYEINGMLASLKGHLNIMCMEIGEQGGEQGRMWSE
jgi:hypothetical protein